MTNPATPDDLEARFWRPLTEHELGIAQTWLDSAYRKVLRRRPNLEADVTAENISEDDVIDVVCAMVGRVFSNPEGKAREAIDDYSYGRSEVHRDGLLLITPDELADLTPGRATRRSVRLVVYGDE